MTTAAGVLGIAKAKEEYITRFDIHQRIQHVFLMVTFIILVLTGMPLKFADAGISRWWISVLGGLEMTRTFHHIAAWAMLADCFYHAVYLVINIGIRKKPFPIGIIPSMRDMALLIQEIAYFAGFRKEKPKFDRYNWKEKFDYWAIFWGVPIMGFSGLILMFPVLATKYLPGWMVPVAYIAHSDESMLALTWIVVVHIFFNHMTPGIFPMNTSIFTGKLSKEKYLSEHPVEYARIIRSTMVEKAEEVEPKVAVEQPVK